MLTWLFCALDLYTALFKAGRHIPISAEKELDAGDMLKRIQFIYSGIPGNPNAPGLPEWMRSRAPARFRWGDPIEIEFLHNGSLIRACPEGADVGRGKTISRWRNEESRTQRQLEKTSQAVLPTLRNGGGQAVYVSSAGPGYFEQLVYDKIDPGDPIPPHHYRLPSHLTHGLQLWRNARNGYTVLRIHYTADPKKRAPEWQARTRKGMPAHAWAMEYEIDFTARGGQPALDFFTNNYSRIVIPPFNIPSWWPRIAFGDYGTTNPYCWLLGAISPSRVLVVYDEYYSPGLLRHHLDALKSHSDFPLLQSYILDRSCWAKTQQASYTVEGQTLHGLRSIAELHEEYGVFPVPATVTRDTVKVEALGREWDRNPPLEPTTVIFSTCTNLIRELPNIRWAEKVVTVQGIKSNEKLVDEDNHAFDALCYGVLHYRESGIAPPPDISSLPIVEQYRREEQLRTRELQARFMKRLARRHEEEAEYEESYSSSLDPSFEDEEEGGGEDW